jgi:site-specific recombinase XerD
LLWRLGLRRSEVAGLRLDDVRWQRGELLVRGKGGRHDLLPLPADVGSAMAMYIRRGRPACSSRALFLRSRAPFGPLSPAGVTAVVEQMAARAGLSGISPHRLRHTAATEMLRRGSLLEEIAQVLRHRSVATTAIYAKVDHGALRLLALPWPGSKSS